MSRKEGDVFGGMLKAVSYTVGILSFLFAVYTVLNDRVGSRLYWNVSPSIQIDPQFESILDSGIVQKANGNTVFISTIDIWNGGNRDIRPDDKADIVISARHLEIIKLVPIYWNYDGEPPVIDCDTNECVIELKSYRVGFGTQFLSVTKYGYGSDLSIEGSITGGKLQKSDFFYPNMKGKLESIAIILMSFFLIVVFTKALSEYLTKKPAVETSKLPPKSLILVLICFWGSITIAALYLSFQSTNYLFFHNPSPFASER